MKIATGSSLTTSNISSSGKSFGISANGKAFKILSSSLYNYKPLAVVREISCNARDAHAMSKCLDRPFVVHLPAIDEPHFVVRDFGPGLADADIFGLYTTYFQSTKTESEEAIGGFGLGSKSPLSYANSFQVISFHGGMKRTYLAFTKDSGEPDIYCLTETPSDEPTGLEVRVPVVEADFKKFRRSAENVFRFFAVKPIVYIGNHLMTDESLYSFKLEDVETDVVEYEAGRFARFYQDKPMSEVGTDHVWAKMGDVIYPVSITHVFEDGLVDEQKISQFYKSNRYGKVVVDCVIGELDLNAGREGLSYDRATIARLKTILSIVYAKLVRVVNEQIANCTSMQDAIKMCLAKDKFFGSACVSGMFSWRNKPVILSNYATVLAAEKHHASWKRAIDGMREHVEDIRYSMLTSARNGEEVVRALGDHNIERVHIDYSRPVTWIIADEAMTGAKGSVRERLKLALKTPNISYQRNVLVVRGVDIKYVPSSGAHSTTTNHKDIAAAKDELQALFARNDLFPDIRFLSSLPVVPKTAAIAAGPGATKAKEQIYKVMSSHRIEQTHMFRLAEFGVTEFDEDATAPHLYLIGNKSSIKFNGSVMGVSRSSYRGYDFGGSHSADLIHRWVRMLLERPNAKPVTIHYLTPEQQAKIQNNPNWISVEQQLVHDIGQTLVGLGVDWNVGFSATQLYDRDVYKALMEHSLDFKTQVDYWNERRIEAETARKPVQETAISMLNNHHSLVVTHWDTFVAATRMKDLTQEKLAAMFSRGRIGIEFGVYVSNVAPFLNACSHRNTINSKGWENDVCRLWNDSPTKMTAYDFINAQLKEKLKP